MLTQLKNNRKTIFIIIVIICLIIIGSSVYIIFFNSYEQSYDEIETISNNIIDDRISPLTKQGLILEIKRIRHRGLLDEIMKVGISWRKKPSFYVITDIDGLKYSSYEEYGFTYDTWDSIFQENRIIKSAGEEQETSDITITLMEITKKGLLGIRSSSHEREKIHINYDYRTGRWDGDDFFMDNDGYGHYLGAYFELWFNVYQTDFDHDGIPYWTEVNVLGTNPREDDSVLDPDRDGIPSTWEWRWSYDPFIWDDHMNLDPDIDGIENIEEYQMEKWFADPFSQDIYVEVDGMKKGGLLDWNHILYEESKQLIFERFAQHGFNVYVDDGWPNRLNNGGGELLDHIETFSWDSGIMLQFYDNHFSDERREIFRYLVICDAPKPPGFMGNSKFNRYDTMVVGTSPRDIFFGQFAFTPRAWRLMLAAAVMHELGHTLALTPITWGGCDNSSFANKLLPRKARSQYLEEWGNYKSVMNYYYVYDKNLIDYSDGSHGYHDQNDWEQLYLPFFQMECMVVVEPFLPTTDKGVDENVSIRLDGWSFDQNLRNILEENQEINNLKLDDWNLSVFVKNDNTAYLSDRNIRVYARPCVSISGWSLIYEGYREDNEDI